MEKPSCCEVELRRCQDKLATLRQDANEQNEILRIVEADRARGWTEVFRIRDQIEILESELKRAIFERDEARSERGHMEAKLEKSRANARNARKHNDRSVEKWSDAYSTLMRQIHSLWVDALSARDALENDDSNQDGVSE